MKKKHVSKEAVIKAVMAYIDKGASQEEVIESTLEILEALGLLESEQLEKSA